MPARRLRRHRWIVAAAGVLAGCGGGAAAGAAGVRPSPVPRVPPPSQLDAVYVLESSGVPADDTVVTYPRGRGRVIVLRRGAPDNSLFAEIAIAADSGGGTATVSVRPQPGLYGIEFDTSAAAAGAVKVTFSYGVHFVAPAGARARYGSDLLFEEALSVARVEPDGRVVFLPTTRPGSDMVAAIVPGPGRYVVAAPGAAR